MGIVWLSIRLEFMGNLISMLVAAFSVASRGQLTVGFTGLVISYTFNLTQSMGHLIRSLADLENNIVSVERIKEYSEVVQEVNLSVFFQSFINYFAVALLDLQIILFLLTPYQFF
ncbi:unnamed protein product [Protopolystoma xenopodis]|uniref:ABC transmembrane type-1 domain-containing protein n=1 Tax=Protopolystoma xenopodis TaxID=117903 RepID=A0A448X4C5_9PLAT|nr:unnamed protein product [Protopolystoma xenopodis]